ncbi:MAG: HAD family hydrolase [Bacillota bacterium]
MKKAIIFDFDDTLVCTNDVFNHTKDHFYQLMDKWQLSDERIAEVLNTIDIANVKKAGGLTVSCFPRALRQTYLYYCRKKGQVFQTEKANLCEQLGWQVFEEKPLLMPGTIELLEFVKQQSYQLYLLTQGDAQLQRHRLQMSGIMPYFKDYRIVKAKKKQHFSQFVKAKNLLPQQVWSIGNSLRSDINPALAAGLSAIHVQIDCWDYETATTSCGGYYTAADLKECKNILLEDVYS